LIAGKNCKLLAVAVGQNLRRFLVGRSCFGAFASGMRSASVTSMPTIQSFRDLLAWQKSMELVVLVYRMTSDFPSSERFGLTMQMRKAAVSVPSNIAEGSRHWLPGYISRVTIALGEHAELETQAIVAERLGYVPGPSLRTFQSLSTQVGELTHGLRRSLVAKLERSSESQVIKSRTPNPESQSL
jgi:four helix bundle protein